MTNSAHKAWDAAYAARPQDPTLSQQITIDIVGSRCIYINDHRVQGGKPYASENLPTVTKTTTVRDVLNAFTVSDLRAYLAEKERIDAFISGVHAYRNAREGGAA